MNNGALVFLVTAAVISAWVAIAVWRSSVKKKKQLDERSKTLPFLDTNIVPGALYNVRVSSGQYYEAVQILGTTEEENRFSLFGWEGALILKKQDGKRIFLRRHSVRIIEEV